MRIGTSIEASSVAPAPATNNRTALTQFQNQLEQARAKRRAAAAVAFVVPADAPSNDVRIEALVAWLGRRHAATNEAQRAYAAAREHATPAEQVLVEREQGELFWELFDAEVRSSLSIFPGIDSAPPERVAPLRSNLAQRYQGDSAKARERFLACLILANQLGLKNADSSRCEEQIRVIDALAPPKQKRDPALEGWQFARLIDAGRSRHPVTRTPSRSGPVATSTWTQG